MKKAFTLSETLITLGIVGIVAALTIPGLIHYFKIKELEVRFKAMDSKIQQALKSMSDELELDDFNKFNSYEACGASGPGACDDTIFKQINESFLSKFKISHSCTSTECLPNYRKPQYYITDFAGNKKIGYSFENAYGANWWGNKNFGTHVLLDGTMITSMCFMHHGDYDSVAFTFDTNGMEKGPNRYGYDIFIWTAERTWYPLCTAKSTTFSEYNGRGCYKYAKKNQDPDKKKANYWSSLKL